MRVLMVSNIYTHPHNMGNRQRIYRECCQIKELGWELDFLYYGTMRAGNIGEMKRFFGKEHFFHVNITSINPKFQLKSIIRNSWDKKGISRYISLYYNADEWYYDEIEEKVNHLLKKKRYDVIWMQYSYQSKVLKNIGDRILKIIDTHDIIAYRNHIFQRKGRVPEGFYVTRRQERKTLSRADLIIAIQQNEEKYFKSLLRGTTTHCITIGDMVEFHKSKNVNKKIFGFIGAENDANVLSIEWLVKKVLPTVFEKEPECKCIVAGGICKLIDDNKYYTKIGRVETISEYYDQISFSINPIQNGTGLNIKGIEALSYGKPLVSTVIGAKGLEEAKGAVSVCKDSSEFVEQIILLLRDEERRLLMSQKAEKFICKYNEKNRTSLKQIEQMVIEMSERIKHC